MNKTISILWIVLTILPLAYGVYFLCFLSSIFPVENGASKEHDLQFKIIATIMSRQMIVVVFLWCLVASYIIYMFKACCLSIKVKVLWIIAFLVGHIFTMPIFWYFNVWRPLNESSNINRIVSHHE